ncbi:MerR family transcriptional regulator [Pedobacter hartonius]|uniref:Helix-turn-helix domain-containing protein n=1 Tax=Pedobacter hartonius TaxID=425514 RepID=A0A1H3WEB0_9SPHI|nr:helix-turn-helix domain-containing protein [Pedobacter hartonius]SDZ84734.1 hypothetical protein SAMN05443550_101191 [Pedobacter hartonius]
MKKNNSKKLDKVLERLLTLTDTQLTREKLIGLSKKELLTTSDFAILFAICTKTVARWREKEKISYVRLSRRYYYFWTDVVALLEANQIKQ